MFVDRDRLSKLRSFHMFKLRVHFNAPYMTCKLFLVVDVPWIQDKISVDRVTE
jgi:hypothetical protein